jgi:AcrR family transcriptional regulator
LVAAYLGYFDEHRESYVAAELGHLEGQGQDEAVAPLLEAGARAILPIVKEALSEGGAGLRRDAPPDPWESALALWAMLDAVLVAAVRRGEEYRGADHAVVAARAVEFMLDGIARGDEPGAGV